MTTYAIKTMKNLTGLIIKTLFVICFCGVGILAQEWQKLSPLVSTCKDVKKYLKVSKCNYPRSKYDFPEFDIVVEFSASKHEWTVPQGIVVNVIVIFSHLPSLNKYNINQAEFTKTQVYDLPNSYILNNEKKGFKLTILHEAGLNEHFIQDIILHPPNKNIISQ